MYVHYKRFKKTFLQHNVNTSTVTFRYVNAILREGMSIIHLLVHPSVLVSFVSPSICMSAHLSICLPVHQLLSNALFSIWQNKWKTKRIEYKQHINNTVTLTYSIYLANWAEANGLAAVNFKKDAEMINNAKTMN